MQTVNFPCVHCKKMMAVTVEDLGCQVHCPHCEKVVQAPAAPPPQPAASPFEPAPTSGTGLENESIFTPPEETGDDLFGVASPPRIDFPSDPASAPTLVPKPPPAPSLSPPEPDSTQTYWLSENAHASRSTAPPPPPAFKPQEADAPTMSLSEPEVEEVAARRPLPERPRTPQPLSEPDELKQGEHATEPAGAEEEAIQPVIRRPQGGGMLLPMLLIFLIPYSIVVTGALAWMLYLQQQQRLHPVDPFEKMLDDSKDGAPKKRVQHDLPMPGKLRTTLNRPIDVGATEVTPLAVQRNEDGNLVLRLRLKNISGDTVFNPLPASFTHIDRRKKGSTNPLPYTFLEFGGGRIYGGDPTWHKGGVVDQNPFGFDGVLQPGEQMTAELETPPSDRDREAVAQATAFRGTLLWRLQVRRGFVQARGKEWPASAVVGIEFKASDIQGAPKG